MRHAVAVCIALGLATPSRADPPRGVYAELLGKGGLWGLGYDQQLSPRFSLGVVGSIFVRERQRYASFSPYVGVYILRWCAHHGWFADAGLQLAHTWATSAIPEWDGDSSTGIGATLSTGYEYRNGVIARVFAHGAAGKGGILPWAGVGFGWAF
jgi:hypothetical protein